MISGPIAVVAPCGAYPEERFAAGLALARDAGFELHPFPDLLRPWRYLAADDEHRLAQLTEALTDPRWAAVWIARGGYGLTRLLPRLDWSNVRRKPVIGFSDATALFSALHARGLGPIVHGPVVNSLPITDAPSREHLWRVLRGEPVAPLVGAAWVDGTADGELVGGNLCLVAALCGTPWQLDARDRVLVLEEIGEAPYRLDRLLQQIASAGVLDGVRAVACGQMLGCGPAEGADFAARDVLLDHLAPLGVPVLGDLPIGHGGANFAFPWGVQARVAHGALSWGW